jgi:copper chaperone NosL
MLLALLLGACASGPPGPAPLDTRNDACFFCRMAASDPRFAAQIVAPGEEPRFFDDVGCLASYVKGKHGALRKEALAYVADHRTKAWVPAKRAVYTRVEGLQTPMGSHVVAHSDAASRAADPEARGGAPMTAGELFGPGGPPAGERP